MPVSRYEMERLAWSLCSCRASEHPCFGQKKHSALVPPEKSLDEVTLASNEENAALLLLSVLYVNPTLQILTPLFQRLTLALLPRGMLSGLHGVLGGF